MSDFEHATRALLEAHGKTLLTLAGRSIEHGLSHGTPLDIDLADVPNALREIGACFVTLNTSGHLRGCIGSPEAHRPLAVDVCENAFASAFRDPRFPKLEASECANLSVDISVLSPSTPMDFADEADLLAQLRPTIDGLIIGDGHRRALFLPSVWDSLPEPSQFLSHLKAKAGLSVDYWSDTFTAHRFIAVQVHSDDLDVPLFSA